jgi:hypothetical protein
MDIQWILGAGLLTLGGGHLGWSLFRAAEGRVEGAELTARIVLSLAAIGLGLVATFRERLGEMGNWISIVLLLVFSATMILDARRRRVGSAEHR